MSVNSVNWSSYHAKSGILDVHFEPVVRDFPEGLESFINRALELTDLTKHENVEFGRSVKEFRILDSFFSDTFSKEQIRNMLKKSKRLSSPVKFLLANPYSEFSKSRSNNIFLPRIQEKAEVESRNGLELILRAMSSVFNITIPKQLSLYNLFELISLVNLKKEFVELRFYDVVPGGPMFFFQDILVTGRYDFGVSSIAMPWYMIINDVYRENDVFDMHWKAFDTLWDLAKPSIVENYRLRLCYTQDQQDAVTRVKDRLNAFNLNIDDAMYPDDVGQAWDDAKRERIKDCQEVLFMCSAQALANPSFCAELSAAWSMAKIIHPILCGGLEPARLNALPMLNPDICFIETNQKHMENLVSGIHERTRC
ncbi:MAG: hypothetical protein HW380_2641 [Magnetococcales bacterium]|nr:hypothetical protein [Magnetococcales bacterium]